ncbi:VCBS repeat-containing protein [Akkermansiaceae bacterium]|nr:VCBS repeat-containing protein [Akkermansiaceae bacterium]
MKAFSILGPLGLVLVLAAEHHGGKSSVERLELSKGVYTEGASFGDVNGDGSIDLLAGPLWWEGPNFKTSHRYRAGEAVPAKGYKHNSFQSWVRDMNGDGRADVFQVAHDGNFHLDLYLQPEEPSEDWPRYRVVTKMGNESPEMGDVTSDGNEELIAMQGGKFGYFSPDWSAPEKPWTFHAISEVRTKSPYYHGLGFGDLNGDGRVDVLEKGGWYEGPKSPHHVGNWTFHPYLFSVKGGAQMLVYDVDGDGDNDVVTSLAGHAWGLAWFENHELAFTRHILIPEEKKPGAGGVVFTQAHALVSGDFNGDGLTDFATGKRYFAHNGNDPDSKGPAVLYWYELNREAGKATFVPHLIDSNSGAGTQLAAADVNGDGKTDLGVGNKKGVFIFRVH